jgi:pimeloyl-ACP methyl ester carboxylesterase
MRHPDRLTGLFAHAGNFDAGGLTGAGGPAWGAYERWARASYRRLAQERCGGSGQDDFDGLKAALRPMWRGEPRWRPSDLARIAVPTAVVLGDRDEAIRCGHTKRLAAAIPGARLMILPGVGHFALRQDPAAYNAAILAFLDGKPPPGLGDCR